MGSLTFRTRTRMSGLRFLLTPEDSSAASPGVAPPFAAAPWNGFKTLLWLVFSVLAALMVGQL